MNLNKLNNKNKIIISTVLFLAYAFLTLYFVIFKSITDIKTIKRNILDQKINLEKNLIRDKNMAVLAKQLETIEPKLEKLNKIFINSSRELEFITTLENAANEAQVSQKIILSPDSSSKIGEYKKIPIKLSLNGNFKNLFNYLTRLEALPYYINIQSLILTKNKQNISSRTNAGSLPQGTISLEISADTFWE